MAPWVKAEFINGEIILHSPSKVEILSKKRFVSVVKRTNNKHLKRENFFTRRYHNRIAPSHKYI